MFAFLFISMFLFLLLQEAQAITINSVVSSLHKQGNWLCALQFLREADVTVIEPNIITYSSSAAAQLVWSKQIP